MNTQAKRKNPHAVALGRKGGKVGGKAKTAAKAAAARENGKKGGRPAKLPVIIIGLVLALLLVSGCEMSTSPISPTPLPQPVTPVTPTPTPSGPPFTVQLVSSGSTVFTDTQWSGGLSITPDTSQISPARPAVVAVNCGNGTAVQTMAGFFGQVPVVCLFPAPGTFTVITAATATTGFTASAATLVTATVRPAPPTPTPAPTPAPDARRVTINAAAIRCTTNRAFYAFSAQANVPIETYTWDFGDGGDADGPAREVGHEYSSDGFKTITVAAKPKDSGDTLSSSLFIFVKFATAAAPTVCP